MQREQSVGELGNRILGLLEQANGWLSSARMLEQLGVSRMAVSKQVRSLRGAGYSIEAAPRRGYRLVARTDRPLPGEVQPLLRTQVVGRSYRYFLSIDSTNDYLKARLRDLPDGTTVLAETQSRGRGRLQRPWFSPPGRNLYLSVLLKPAASPALAPQLSLVAAAALLRTLHAAGCREAVVKWPNDVLWRGRKLAGILCEMEAEADLIHGVVIGIGLNVNLKSFPRALAGTAGSLLLALGHAVERPALAAALLNALDAEYASWARDGLAPSVRFLNAHSHVAGQEVAVTLPQGVVRGKALRITDEGLLRLALKRGAVRDIASGEVQLCRPAAPEKGVRHA